MIKELRKTLSNISKTVNKFDQDLTKNKNLLDREHRRAQEKLTNLETTKCAIISDVSATSTNYTSQVWEKGKLIDMILGCLSLSDKLCI